MDITDYKAVESLLNRWGSRADAPEIFINNAGCGYYGPAEELSEDKINEMIALNIVSLTFLTKLETLKLELKGGGLIMNVASTAAFQPGPYAAVYYASKSYVLNYSLAAGYELKNKNIKMSVFCPGPTATPFHKKAGLTSLRPVKLMDPEKAAKFAYKGLKKGRSVIIPGVSNVLLTAAGRCFPRQLVMKIIGKINSDYKT